MKYNFFNCLQGKPQKEGEENKSVQCEKEIFSGRRIKQARKKNSIEELEAKRRWKLAKNMVLAFKFGEDDDDVRQPIINNFFHRL